MTTAPSIAGCIIGRVVRARRKLGGAEFVVFEGWERRREEKSWPDMMMPGAPCEAIMCNDLPFLSFRRVRCSRLVSSSLSTPDQGEFYM